MKFKVTNAHEQHWVEVFARKNGFASYEGFWPSLVEICLSDKTIEWYGPTKEKYLPITELINKAQGKEIVMYEGGLIAGPFKIETKNEPQIGNTVKIVDAAYCYRTYWEWFKDYPDIAARYAYTSQENINGKVGTIVALGPHSEDYKNIIYAIEIGEDFRSPIYLIGREAFVVEEDTNNEILD